MLPISIRRRGSEMEPQLTRRDFDRLFDRFFTRGPWEDLGEITGQYPVDISEDDNSLYVEAELPGFKREEIDVTLEQGVLRISAERKAQEAKGQRHLTERQFTRVERSFTLPTAVDESKIEAHLEGGVLHLTLPKTAEVKPRKIEVKETQK